MSNKGSLIQLVSNGAKDIILTSEPNITYFKKISIKPRCQRNVRRRVEKNVERKRN